MARLPQGAFEGDQVRRELDRILASPEFSSEQSVGEEVIEWILERLDGADVGAGSRMLFWSFAILVGLLLVLLLYKILRIAWVGSRQAEEVLAAPVSIRDRVRELRLSARQASSEGDLPRALRLLFFGLVLGLGDRGDLEFREAWTEREILRRGNPRPRARELLERLLGEMEAKRFGGESVDLADVERLEGICEQFLGGLGSEVAA